MSTIQNDNEYFLLFHKAASGFVATVDAQGKDRMFHFVDHHLEINAEELALLKKTRGYGNTYWVVPRRISMATPAVTVSEMSTGQTIDAAYLDAMRQRGVDRAYEEALNASVDKHEQLDSLIKRAAAAANEPKPTAPPRTRAVAAKKTADGKAITEANAAVEQTDKIINEANVG